MLYQHQQIYCFMIISNDYEVYLGHLNKSFPTTGVENRFFGSRNVNCKINRLLVKSGFIMNTIFLALKIAYRSVLEYFIYLHSKAGKVFA